MFRKNPAVSIVCLVFGILGTTFMVVGGSFSLAQRRGGLADLPPFFPLIYVGLGGAFLLTALLLLIALNARERRRQAVVARGNLVYATVTDVRRNMTVRVNGRHPYVVECRYEENGTVYLLSSPPLWNGRPEIAPGTLVPVFWDEYDTKHYTVDLSGLLPGQVVDLR